MSSPEGRRHESAAGLRPDPQEGPPSLPFGAYL